MKLMLVMKIQLPKKLWMLMLMILKIDGPDI
jgi:hypothetical protein